ncbi:uncharacterized protein LOC133197737 [Saccostrea echinata]|uniref:uncharacterized protein LOC133197737 n=1 Tax=Saccostrea echinata TaxID=191078 RepID=UPI002A824A94|nr:uncharacterized protein LOC133197737 [Saccostrea echinata]
MVYGNIPSHIKAPEGVELKPSKVDRRITGAWCTSDVKQGSLFGPFKGEIVQEHERKKIDFRYAWEVYDLETSELIHIINATDPNKGDWTRYVNCARYLEEQNLVSVQEGTQVFYKAIRDIPAGEELLTWFERSRIKKNSNSSKTEASKTKGKGFFYIEGTTSPKKKTTKRSKSDSSLGLGENVTISEKRQRKKKKIFGDVEEVSLAELIPKKRTKRSVDSQESVTEDPTTEAITTQIFNSLDVDTIKVYSTSNGGSEFFEADKKKIKEIEDNWKYPPKRREYQFGFLNRIATSVNNRRMYKCNICGGLYRHKFSLKRHYLRNHINCQYLSKAAITNCMISVASQYHAVVQENGEEAVNRIHTNIHIKLEDGDTNYDEKSDDSASETVEEESFTDTASNTEENLDESLADINPDEKFTESGLYPGLYRCNVCNKLFDKAPELTDHTKEHSEVPDAKTFACSLCNMTFKFKMNLVRHQLVHEGKTSGNNTVGTSKQKIKIEPVNDSGDPKRPFMCSQCPMKFKYSTNLVKHEAVHSDDRPCKCTVCDKSFPSMTNLKKHMNIHIGCKVPCRHCEAVFSHVGALRKHIRLLHPTVHRERLLKLLEKQGKLGVKAQKYLDNSYENENSKSSDRGSTCSSSNEGDKETKAKKEKKSKTRIEDGIDSRFKFSCTICKKRFTEYVNMCRHRRVAHEEPDDEINSNVNSEGSSESANVVEENPELIAAFFANVAYNIAENLTCYLDGGQEALEAHSRREVEEEEVDVENVEEEKKVEEPSKIALDQYNFPLSYNPRLLQENFEYCPLDPSELMKKYEKEVPNYFDVNIDENSLDDRGPALCTRRRNSKDSKDDSRDSIWGNRFDSSVTNSPAKSERSESPMLKITSVFSGKEAAMLVPETPKKEPSGAETKEDNGTITIAPLEDEADKTGDTKEKLGHDSEEQNTKEGVTETLENDDKKVNVNVKLDQKETPKKSSDDDKPLNTENKINEELKERVVTKESSEMKSTPLKDSQTSAVSSISPSDINGNRKQSQESTEKTEKCVKSEGGDQSLEENQQNGESEHLPRRHIFKIMEYSKLKKGGLTVICHSDLQKAEKNKTGKEDNKTDSVLQKQNDDVNLNGPKASADYNSTVGMNVGDGSDSKPKIEDTGSDDSNSGILLVDLFTDSDSDQTNNKDHDLMLQGLDLARGTKGRTEEKKPKSSSAGNSPQRSPLYNYETIMFGKLGDTAYVCSVCKRHYPDFDRLLRHQWKKHPSIYCDFMEVEQGHEIESLYYSKPCNRGLLGSSGKALERAINRPSYTCTRCRGSFKSVDRLRVHIINCATPQPSPKKKKSYYKRKTPIKTENGEFESPSKLPSQVNIKELNSRMKELSAKSDKEEDKVVRAESVNSEEVGPEQKTVSEVSERPTTPVEKKNIVQKKVGVEKRTTPEKKVTPDKKTISEKRVTPEKVELVEDKMEASQEKKVNEQKTLKLPSIKPNEKKKMVEKKINIQVKGKSAITMKFKGKAAGKSVSPVKIKTEQSKAVKLMKVSENIQQKKSRRKRDFVIYNPRNHIRRREFSEVLDKQQCKGCGVKFKTISLLERHVKKCDEKDKFKDIKLIKSNVNEVFHQKQRHTCFYCNKGFIYPKSLMNHFKAFCLVKKERGSNGVLSEEDKATEAVLMKRLIQQEEDRKITTEEFDMPGRKKGGWPRGKKRKHRRKNHSWTIIKQKKPSSSEADIGVASVQELDMEASEMERRPQETAKGNMKSKKSIKSQDVKEQSKQVTKSSQKGGSKRDALTASTHKSGTSKGVAKVVSDSASKGKKGSESNVKKEVGPKAGKKSLLTSSPDDKEKSEKDGIEPPRKRGRKKSVKEDSNDIQNPGQNEEVKAKKVKIEENSTASDGKQNKETKKPKKVKSDGTTKESKNDLEDSAEKLQTDAGEGDESTKESTQNSEGKMKKGKISFNNPDMKFVTMKNIVKKGGGGGTPIKTVEKEVEEASEKVSPSKLTFHIYDSNSFTKKKTTTALGPGLAKKFHIMQPKDFVGKSTQGEGSIKVGEKGKKSGEGEQSIQGGKGTVIVRGGPKRVVVGETGGQETQEGGEEGTEKKSTGSNKIKGIVNRKPDMLQFHQVDVAAMKNKKGSKGLKKT